jgi:hypothetical protein
LAAVFDADVRFLVTRLGWGGVAVVGAGLSLAARYPLTSLLPPLVWKGVDADPESREKLAAAVGANADLPAKQLVGHDPAMLNRAWEIIETSGTARAAFQNGFAALDRERAGAPTPAFDALARLLHARIIEQIVSFNWDTGVEVAYRRRYGPNIPPGLLFQTTRRRGPPRPAVGTAARGRTPGRHPDGPTRHHPWRAPPHPARRRVLRV